MAVAARLRVCDFVIEAAIDVTVTVTGMLLSCESVRVLFDESMHADNVGPESSFGVGDKGVRKIS